MAKTESTTPVPKKPEIKGFKRKAAVTLPAIKEEVEVPLYVRFESDIKEEAEMGDNGKPKLNDDGTPKMTHTATAVDLQTGELGTFVFRAATLNEIRKHCDSKIKGRSFEIVKHDKKEGKKYYQYTIFELEDQSA